MEEIEVDTTSESPTEIEQMFVQQMQAQLAQEQEEERIEIISLTATAMELDADGPHICSRA